MRVNLARMKRTSWTRITDSAFERTQQLTAEAVDPQFVIFSSGHDHQHPTHNAANRVLTHGLTAARMFRTDFGDDESGWFEWKAGSIPGAAIPRAMMTLRSRFVVMRQ